MKQCKTSTAVALRSSGTAATYESFKYINFLNQFRKVNFIFIYASKSIQTSPVVFVLQNLVWVKKCKHIIQLTNTVESALTFSQQNLRTLTP